jgi:hypothetical protein
MFRFSDEQCQILSAGLLLFSRFFAHRARIIGTITILFTSVFEERRMRGQTYLLQAISVR